VTSGIRLGTPAGTTRGFRTAEFHEIGLMISEVLDGIRNLNSEIVELNVREKVLSLTKRFPIY
jgi:glycine hydroxymethyltransferase